MRLSPRLRALAATSALVAAGAAPAFGAPGCADRLIADADGFTTIRPPRYDAGPATITAYAVDRDRPDVLWVTNGRAVARSADAGCTFVTTFTVPAAAEADPVTSVTALTWAPGGAFAVVNGPAGPRVFRESGSGWRAATGLPPAGTASPVTTTVTPGGPAYLLVETGTASVPYRSADGVTWEPVTPAPGSAPGGVLLDDIVVDPRDGDRLWGLLRLADPLALLNQGDGNLRGGAAEGLYTSADGGRTWSQITQVTGKVRLVDVVHEPGEKPFVLAYMTDEQAAFGSDDGGATWRLYATPGSFPARSATHGRSALELVVSIKGAFGSVYRFDPDREAWVRIRHGGPAIDALSADHHDPPAYFGLSSEGVVHYRVPRPAGSGGGGRRPEELPASTSRCRDGEFAYGLTPPPGRQPARPTLVHPPYAEIPAAVVPARPSVTLPVGGSATVPVTFTPQRTPLDVFFLIDTTGSMHTTICAVRNGVQAVAARLAKSGVDVRFGLAQYRDYPASAFPSNAGEEEMKPYVRDRDIGFADDELALKMSELVAGMGGSRPEAALTALQQAATGAGEDVGAPGPSPGDTPAGQGASFRRGAQRAVVVITDAPFHNGPSGARSPDWPGPSWPRVVATLRQRGIMATGLDVSRDTAARADLRGLAVATGTYTPLDLDCDGDAYVDVRAGEPAVCDVPIADSRFLDIAAALTNLLRALPDRAPVALIADGGTVLGGPVQADLKRRNRLNYTVEVRCAGPGRRAVALTGTAKGRVAAEAAVEVTCVGGPPAADPPPAVAAPLPPPPPPQQPALPGAQPRVEVAGQTQPQPQNQPQAHANGVAVTQPQEQPQVVGVTVPGLSQPQSQYAAVRRERRPSPAPLLGVGFLLMTATAFAMSRVRVVTTGAKRWR